MRYTIHTLETTRSTNEDARSGVPGDVFVAREQTAGRGRLDHRWVSEPGANLLMSVVLDVAGIDPAEVATLPLAVGLAVRAAVAARVPVDRVVQVKWPNDVLVNGRKIAGILCERRGDNVIAGIGLNVRQQVFPSELADRATSIARETARAQLTIPPVQPATLPAQPAAVPALVAHIAAADISAAPSVEAMRDTVLDELDVIYRVWRARGFAAIHPAFVAADALKDRIVSVRQTDHDAAPIRGLCGGILPDGTLDVGGIPVPAGEAHVEES